MNKAGYSDDGGSDCSLNVSKREVVVARACPCKLEWHIRMKTEDLGRVSIYTEGTSAKWNFWIKLLEGWLHDFLVQYWTNAPVNTLLISFVADIGTTTINALNGVVGWCVDAKFFY